MLVGVIGLRNLTTHINTNINMNNEHQYNHQSNQLPTYIDQSLPWRLDFRDLQEVGALLDVRQRWRVEGGRWTSKKLGNWNLKKGILQILKKAKSGQVLAFLFANVNVHEKGKILFSLSLIYL